jgi:hypothetical protein
MGWYLLVWDGKAPIYHSSSNVTETSQVQILMARRSYLTGDHNITYIGDTPESYVSQLRSLKFQNL